MRRLLLSLVFATLCLAAPQRGGNGKDADLDSLIFSIFKKGGSMSSIKSGLQQISNQQSFGGHRDYFDGSISNVYQDDQNVNNTTDVVLDTQNKPTSSSDDDCKCVPYYQCQEGNIAEDGMDVIDIRSFGPCENYLETCCKPEDIITESEEKIVPLKKKRKGCGQRHSQGVGFRITGNSDNEAQFGEFPWMVAILKETEIGKGQKRKVNVYICGGALIHKRAVLTAAHCVNGKKASKLTVRAGEWDSQTKEEVFPHQDRKVETFVVHEKFHPSVLHNDYAILILSKPVEFAENVDVVCLPDKDTVYDTRECFASGWGKNKFGEAGRYQAILKRVNLPIVSRDTCQNALRWSRLGKHFSLHKTFICAGGESGKDTCEGDGGGPLVCPLKNDPERYVQVGIVSWGIGCGGYVPGVYANVPYIRQWIDEQMISYNLDSMDYQYNLYNLD